MNLNNTRRLNMIANQNLTREQKEAIGILSIGTFLEYFDLMLYVHMAVLLNEVFFPVTDPLTASLLATFAFISTYLMRPVGAIIFGYIGDNIGRKFTLVITTSLMALSSIAIFFLPTYAQIGITASWLITGLRMIQGVSSMGEIIGAELYLTELIKPPKQYFAVALMVLMSSVGTLAALGMSAMILKYNINWRYAFLIGSFIALVGIAARTSLRETTEFLAEKKRQLAKKILNIQNRKKVNLNPINKKIALSFFLIESGHPIWMYMTYIYYGMFLKRHLGYSAADVIQHNFYLSIVGLIAGAIILFLVTKIHPLRIMKIRACLFVIGLPFFIWNLEHDITIFNVLMFQVFVKIFNPTNTPAHAVFFKHFPILRRFTVVSLLNAASRLLMYGCTAFGMIYLTEYFNTYGLLFIIVPIVIGYFYGLNTFIQLEKATDNYPIFGGGNFGGGNNADNKPANKSSQKLESTISQPSEFRLCQYSKPLLKKIEELNKNNLSPAIDVALVKTSIIWAKKYHGLQLRKSGEPFYSHPLIVAYQIIDYSSEQINTDILVAAILHDIVEDTEVTNKMIFETFGHRVSELVDQVTRDRPNGIKLSISTIIDRMIKNNDMTALSIKEVDRLHNMQTIQFQSLQKQHDTALETMHNIVGHTANIEVERQLNYLSAQVSTPNQAASIKKLYENKISLSNLKYKIPSPDRGVE